ncbi:MAG: hypothetical protein M1821_002881 [Bathelium mastoideum]|nr:MAG: hypothetical protein M1821_002881 [Bathelium mastoideum]
MQQDVLANEADFVEDVLKSIYHQLGRNVDASSSAYQQYEEACQRGSRVTLRIQAIRKALEARLGDMDGSFVIIDDLDHCNQALDVLLREQLAILQRQRLKIMTTSRLPVWEVEISIPIENMEKFVEWDLERVHGDLGFGSSSEGQQRPLSMLGMALRYNDGEGAQKLRTSIANSAFGNVGMAKLRLETTYDSTTLEEVEMTRDRLPRNAVAIFDAGMKRLEAQPAAHRELGLRIIAASCQDPQGVPLQTIEDWLGQPFRSPEDVFQVTRGWLKIHQTENRKVQAYHGTFGVYVKENYNESLFRARSALRIRRIPRSASIEVFRVPLMTPMTPETERFLELFPNLQIAAEEKPTTERLLAQSPNLQIAQDERLALEKVSKVERGRSSCYGYIWRSADLDEGSKH